MNLSRWWVHSECNCHVPVIQIWLWSCQHLLLTFWVYLTLIGHMLQSLYQWRCVQRCGGFPSTTIHLWVVLLWHLSHFWARGFVSWPSFACHPLGYMWGTAYTKCMAGSWRQCASWFCSKVPTPWGTWCLWCNHHWRFEGNCRIICHYRLQLDLLLVRCHLHHHHHHRVVPGEFLPQ